PEEVLDRQIAYYENMGINFKTGVIFGKDMTTDDLEKQGYKACIAATGAAKPFGLSVEGSGAEGITSAMEYLEGIKAGSIKMQNGKVAVIGGGSVALDAARSAVRLGADEVNLICLEVLEADLKDSMLALTEEIEDAQAEGVVIHPSRGVDSFETKNGKVSSIKCVECTNVRDEDGRFNPRYGDCVLPLEIQADTVVLAIGQSADPSIVPEGFNTNERGYIVADSQTKQVDSNLFAAGDAVSGPSTIVEALAAGRRTALTVDRFIKGENMTAGLEDTPNRFEPVPNEKIFKAYRINRQTVPAEERKIDFQETMLPLGWYEAHMESDRCLTCGSRSAVTYLADCQACTLCEHYCPTDAITVVPGAMPNILHAWNVINLGK
ncbi:FAD-dependent oxidoreductase, partial [Thermodesulfobacteriota bacterium]